MMTDTPKPVISADGVPVPELALGDLACPSCGGTLSQAFREITAGAYFTWRRRASCGHEIEYGDPVHGGGDPDAELFKIVSECTASHELDTDTELVLVAKIPAVGDLPPVEILTGPTPVIDGAAVVREAIADERTSRLAASYAAEIVRDELDPETKRHVAELSAEQRTTRGGADFRIGLSPAPAKRAKRKSSKRAKRKTSKATPGGMVKLSDLSDPELSVFLEIVEARTAGRPRRWTDFGKRVRMKLERIRLVVEEIGVEPAGISSAVIPTQLGLLSLATWLGGRSFSRLSRVITQRNAGKAAKRKGSR